MKPINVQLELFSSSSPPLPSPPRSKSVGIFTIGDRVEIRASDRFYGFHAVIEDFDGQVAIIRAPAWVISRRYQISDLRFLSS